MSWTTDLAAGIKDALSRGGIVRVAVHTEAQIELGKIAAQRMNPEKANNIQFELIPANECELYPVGTILA